MAVNERAAILGLFVKCPQLGCTFIERENFAIGPISSSQRKYIVRCNCGKVHSIRTQLVSKPSKQRPAISLKRKRK